MKNHPSNIPPLPLSSFLLKLEAAKLPVDPARAMRLRAILEEKGQDYLGRLPEMKYLLAPFIARNAKEQAEVYRIWEDFVVEYEEEWEQWGQATTKVASVETPWYIKYRGWLLAAALIPILSGFAYFFWEGGVEPIIEQGPVKVAISPPLEDVFRAGQEVELQNATPEPLSREDSASFHWRVLDANTGRTLYDEDNFHFRWVVAEGVGEQLRIELSSSSPRFMEGDQIATLSTAVYCADPPDLSEVELSEGPYELRSFVYIRISESMPEPTSYLLDFGDGTTTTDISIRHQYEVPGTYRISLRATQGRDTSYCSTLWLREITVQEAGKPYLAALPLQRDTPRQYLQVTDWVWGLVLWPLLVSLFFWKRWRKRRREQAAGGKEEEDLAAAYPFFDQGPYYIPYHDQESKIKVPADFYRIADQLRLREAGSRTVFDSHASVAATIKGGGYPTWQEKSIHKPTEYLLLLPYTHEFEQQECLLRRLAKFLTDHEAAITTYYHRGDFRHFWNADHPDGWRGTRLYSRYQGHRLLILGTGHGLLDPYETVHPRLIPDVERLFLRWPRRLLLTTEPVADWSWQERLLHQHFLLYPADTEGIRQGAVALNQIEEYEAGPYDKWTAEIARHRFAQSCRYRNWDSVADHQDYLKDDPELFHWLCGLAVASQPDFKLTIAIGRALAIDVDHDRLLQLGRIPWLAGNAADNDLRLGLITELNSEDETKARLAVLSELEAVAGQVKGSFAQTEWVANKAVQQFSLEPANADYKQSIRELRQLGLLSGDQLQELEQGLDTGRLQEETSTTELPQLDRWLDSPEPKPWFTMDLVWGLLLCLIALIGSLACWDYNRGNHAYTGGELDAWQTSVNVDDSALTRNNNAVFIAERMMLQERYDSFLLQQSYWDEAAYMLNEANRMRDGDYPLADSNRYALEYNRRTKYLNFFLSDSTDYPDGLEMDAIGLILEEGQSNLDEFMDNPQSDWSLKYRHATGLMAFYLSDVSRQPLNELPPLLLDSVGRPPNYIATAVEQYAFLQQTRSGQYFDSLNQSMPDNLETVLRPYLLNNSGLRSYYYGLLDEEQRTAAQQEFEQGLSAVTEQEQVEPQPAPVQQTPNEQIAVDDRLELYREWAFNYQRLPYRTALLNIMESVNSPNIRYRLGTALEGLTRNISAISAQELIKDYVLPLLTQYDLIPDADQDGVLLFGSGQPSGVASLDNIMPLISEGTKVIMIGSWDYNYPGMTNSINPTPQLQWLQSIFNSLNITDVELLLNPSKAELDQLFTDLLDSESGKTLDSDSQFVLYISGYILELENEILYYLSSTDPTRRSTYYNLTPILDGPSNLLSGPNAPKKSLLLLDAEYLPDDPPQEQQSTVSAIRPQMVSVPAGTFTMGDTFGEGDEDELPLHEVTLSAFQMGRYEVTFDEYDRFCEATGKGLPDDGGWGRGRRPVINVTWYDVVSYCNWLSQELGLEEAYYLADPVAQAAWAASGFAGDIGGEEVLLNTANGYRLPTEAEWEYAASYTGEVGKKWRFGNGRDTARAEEINFDAEAEDTYDYSVVGESRRQTLPFGQLGTAHPLGIHELSGNVWEWCNDWRGDYAPSEQRNPKGPENGRYRVLRGGSWFYSARSCRVTNRGGARPSYGYDYYGFRLVLAPSSG